MKKLLTIALAAITGGLFAATVTWDGDANDNWWGTASNWSGDALPTSNDEVSIDNNITVNANANVTLPVTLKLGDGTTVLIENNELQFSGACTISGGSVTANLLAAQAASSSITISDCQLTNKSSGHVKGFWRNDDTAHVNFVPGISGSATYTFQTTLIENNSVYGTFVNITNPLIKYNGANIASEDEFNELFAITSDAEAGTTTLSLKALEGWKVAAPTLGAVANGEVSVTYTATRYSGGNATVVIGCAASDLGSEITAWAGKATEAATSMTDTTTGSTAITLAAGYNYIRVFVTYDGTTVASPAVSVRNLVYGDYGDLTGVYEYIGTDNDLTKASNWVKDGQATETAPTAGTDIRWFGYNAMLNVTAFPLYSTDHFVGATIALADSGNHDSNLNGDVIFENANVTLSTVVVQSDPHVISLKNAHFATTRAPDGVAGFYATVPEKGINFVSGFPSSFSFGADAGDVHDAATVKSQLVDSGKITLDSSTIGAEIWMSYFSVDIVGTTVTVSYSPTVAENRIDEVFASSTSTSATLTAIIGTQETGTLVKFAYGTSVPTDADVLNGTIMTVTDGKATVSENGLTDLTVYHYTFAIVDSGSTEILASKSGLFVASDFAYVYMNGAWQGGAPATTDTADSMLIMSDYNSGTVDWTIANKTVRGAFLGTGTLKGQGPITLYSAQLSNVRNNDYGNCPYGYWSVTAPFIDFRSESGNGVVYAADTYSFYTTKTDREIFDGLITTGAMIQTNGVTVAGTDDFTITENGTSTPAENVTLRNVTLTWFEPFPAVTPGSVWTVKDGARVKLTENVKLDSLTVEGTGAVIDLNGHTLKVPANALTVNGEVIEKGTYTGETLPTGFTNGTVEVLSPGLVLVFR